MKKQRKTPAILKPEIDEETALRFVLAGSGSASKPPADKAHGAASKRPMPETGSRDEFEKHMRQISLTIEKELYDRIAKEAARKNRSVEEHLQRRLMKRYGK